MNKIVSIALLAISLAVTSAQAVITGVSAGYLTDSKREYIAARIGTEFSSSPTLSHIGEFEVGYTDDSDSFVKIRMMPVTANYRVEFKGNGNFTPYLGAGFGATDVHIKVDATTFWTSLGSASLIDPFIISPNPYVIHENHDAWAFTLQGFGGVSYKITNQASLNVGARYIWIDDIHFLGSKIKVGDDVSLELGLHFKF